MKDLQTTSQPALYKELRATAPESYKAETDYFLSYCETNYLNLIDCYPRYAEALDTDGYVDRSTGEQRRYSASSFNKRISAARNRIRYAFKHSPDFADMAKKLQLDEFLSDVKLKKINSHAVGSERVLKWEEVQKLVKETRAPKTRLFIAFLAQTGCRISEALNIELGDMKTTGTYKIRIRGKGGKERYVHATTNLIERIKARFMGNTWLFEHNGSQYNRIAITGMIKTASLRVIGKEISAHVLRHSFATKQLEDGKSLKSVSSYLGHSSTSITADIYQHDSLSAEDAILDFDEGLDK